MAIYRPKRLFHGTLTVNEHSIEKRGICPPESCKQIRQVFPKSYFGGCHADSVYATERIDNALTWIQAAKDNIGDMPPSIVHKLRAGGVEYEYTPGTIYELKVPPSRCLHPDTNLGPGAFRSQGCGCLKPIRKCTVTPEVNRAFYEYERGRRAGFSGGDYDFRSKIDLLCDWQKV